MSILLFDTFLLIVWQRSHKNIIHCEQQLVEIFIHYILTCGCAPWCVYIIHNILWMLWIIITSSIYTILTVADGYIPLCHILLSIVYQSWKFWILFRHTFICDILWIADVCLIFPTLFSSRHKAGAWNIMSREHKQTIYFRSRSGGHHPLCCYWLFLI